MSGKSEFSRPVRAVVFTDLDGTLLDHHGYGFGPARPALAQLHARGIPLILASSKTRAEMAELAQETGAAGFIFENGGGVKWPDGVTSSPDNSGPTATYVEIRGFLDKLPVSLRDHVTGFGDMNDAEVAGLTGLPLPRARLARQREFSEPFVWTGDDEHLTELTRLAAEHGIRLVRGGRFNTLTGPHDKSARMKQVCSTVGPAARVWAIALGDAPNDAAMLEAANRGFIIANPDGAVMPELPGERDGRITRSAGTGPAGWNESVMLALKELDAHSNREDMHG